MEGLGLHSARSLYSAWLGLFRHAARLNKGAFLSGWQVLVLLLTGDHCAVYYYYYSRGAFRCGWDDYLITSRPPTARRECLFTFPSAWSGVALVP